MKKVYQFFMTVLSLSVLGQTLFEREESLQNRPVHFAAYRLPGLVKLCSKEKSLYRTALFISQPIGCLAWSNFVRKRGVFTEPIYTYRLPTKSVLGLTLSIKRECFKNNLNKVLQNH
jgi:hypothetical protein